MKDRDLDHILSREDTILPSSGFASSVMEAVHREATAPPPIPFPWKRALPGLCVAGLALVSVIVACVLLVLRAPATQPIPSAWLYAFASAVQASKKFGAIWVLLALLLSFASVKLAMHLASARTPRYRRT